MLTAIEIVVTLLFSFAFLTQVAIPLATGRKMFPFFRSNEAQLLRERAAVYSELNEQAERERIEKIRTQIRKDL